MMMTLASRGGTEGSISGCTRRAPGFGAEVYGSVGIDCCVVAAYYQVRLAVIKVDNEGAACAQVLVL